MELKSDGRLVFLILYEEGKVDDLNTELLSEIENMESFVSIELFIRPGAHVRRTIDCFTFGGVIRLISPSSEAVQRDYERIRQIEHQGFVVFAKPE